MIAARATMARLLGASSLLLFLSEGAYGAAPATAARDGWLGLSNSLLAQVDRPSAQASAGQAGSSGSAAGADIIVTGTRRTDRAVTDSPAPVDVFDSSILESQASGDMNNVLRNLVPSFNVGRFSISDGSSFVRPPTLRGLPPDQILVLINGKRRHRSALVQLSGGALAAGAQGVDLAQIPTIAVERVEVLRDGAAAQYGSDAIAGVINYGLRRNASGLDLRARYGQFYQGDGENYQLSGNLGLPLLDGFFNVSAEYVNSAQTGRGGQAAGAYLVKQQRPDLAGLIKDPVQTIGDPKVEAGRIFINSAIPLSATDEIYFFGNWGRSEQARNSNWRQGIDITGPDRFGEGNSTLYRRANGVFNTLYLDQLPNGNYSETGRTFSFNSIFPAGFLPRLKSRIDDISGVGGYKGELSFGLSFDFSLGYGQNQMAYYYDETVNPSMGPDSPTSFYMGKLEQRQTNLNADFAYPWEIGLASPVTIAFGGEWRREAYAIRAGDQPSWQIGPYAAQTVERADGSTYLNDAQQIGSNGFPGFSPSSAVDQGRNSWALYLDVEGDLTEALSLGGALRHEHFSDFGTTTNWKATARYEVSSGFAVRGTVSTGFRAPTPGQLFTTNIATGFVGANPIETATLPPSDPAAQFFGASTLEPEKSKSYSAGLVLTPLPQFTSTIDFYQIDVSDRIGMSANFDITTDEQRQALRALGVANYASLGRVRYFTNAFATRTRGVDIVLSHNIDTDVGRFNTVLAANYNDAKVTDRDIRIIDDIRKGNIEKLNPKWRGNISENWSLGDFAVTARMNFFDSFTSVALPIDGGDLKIGSEVTFDLELNYNINDWIKLSVGAENLFDNYPDRNRRSMGAPNQNWYDFTQATVGGGRYVDSSPFGFNGGFWYVRVGTKF